MWGKPSALTVSWRCCSDIRTLLRALRLTFHCSAQRLDDIFVCDDDDRDDRQRQRDGLSGDRAPVDPGIIESFGRFDVKAAGCAVTFIARKASKSCPRKPTLPDLQRLFNLARKRKDSSELATDLNPS